MWRAALIALLLAIPANARLPVTMIAGPGPAGSGPGGGSGGSPAFVDAIIAAASDGTPPLTVSATTDWSVTAGNTIIAACVMSVGIANPTITFSDDDSNSYTTHVTQGKFSEMSVAIGTAAAGASGTVAVTCTAGTGSSSTGKLVVMEFSGIGATPVALDTSQNGSSADPGEIDPAVGGTFTYVSAVASYLGDLGVETPPPGWTTSVDTCDTDVDPQALCVGYYISSGSQTPDWAFENEVNPFSVAAVIGD